MESALFSPHIIKSVTLKNRIVMSPMCMYSCFEEDGKVTNWHLTHYTSRAVGQVGLVMIEATAVKPEGRISANDLGIWDAAHVEGLKQLTNQLHMNGSHAAIQLAHAGRKSQVEGVIYGPSAIAFDHKSRVPIEMTKADIEDVIHAFALAARRAKEAGFDIIEIHSAHGYLLNEFLSPLTNKRTDEYGGNLEKRYRFLKEVIDAVKSEWSGPLFVRVSANDYDNQGNSIEDYVQIAQMMKAQGVDLIDCSSGAVIPTRFDVFPGYQVPYAETIKRNAHIQTGAVGLITTGIQAEEILKNGRADLIFIGRELLRNPYWPKTAAQELGVTVEGPGQYSRAW
ncbi:NADPH dehydrogenase NamA [Cytobacillus sp. IB215665]|uniref:NADPH dehydrogenase NamA n=1 Tax=Cytobacillus sp. IB215665 TaxID=3097357 RepID=UPI002A0EF74E|nr:NADPH dehydrogenase NamA [Cytobacillus sp. IB215665]MDX8365803.1 NADPH dehydrogenase NamA [Cytobacillus sp. IB215665]